MKKRVIPFVTLKSTLLIHTTTEKSTFKANVKDSKNEFILKLLRFYVFSYDTIENEQGELPLYFFFGFRLQKKECLFRGVGSGSVAVSFT